MKTSIITLLLALVPLAGLAEAPKVSMGNGEANWIITEGATRDGSTFTFQEVHIAGNGWLVMHPFKDGKPDGKTVSGYSYVGAGASSGVEITVDNAPASGDHYIVMLHSDVNENSAFDFVFVNEREVLDKAVFEGSTMIGHVFESP